MLRCFGHVVRMDERRLTKELYEANVKEGTVGMEDLGGRIQIK